MTKADAVKLVEDEIRRLREIPARTDNPITASAATHCADKLQWALDLLRGATGDEQSARKAAALDKLDAAMLAGCDPLPPYRRYMTLLLPIPDDAGKPNILDLAEALPEHAQEGE